MAAVTSIHPNVELQISILRTPGDWLNLKGLISCALKYLSTQQDISETDGPLFLECTDIFLLGSGTYNYAYRLCFSSGLQLTASVPKIDKEYFFPAARLSEIATMKFVAESGLYPDIPVPKIYAWEVGFDNEAGAPWILMDLVHGVLVDSEHVEGGGVGVTGFDVYPEARQMAIVKALARLQAHLSKPVPFKEIGSIYLREDVQKTGPTTTSEFKVGPLTRFGQRIHHDSLGGPYASPAQMYTTLLQGHMSHALQHWSSLPTDSIRDPDSPFPLDLTPRTFSDIFHMLTSLIPQFTLPQSTSTLVLHHPDIALRNVFFDEASLKDGTPRITGVIDWAGAQVLPLMLTAIFPGDLMSNTTTPFEPPLLRRGPTRPDATYWNTVPFDWTSAGDPKSDGPASWDGTRTDHGPAVAAQVRRFYLRTYFSACYASQMEEVYGNVDLARASVYREAEYCLKFHEVMCSGLNNWARHEDWVKETYWRLRLSGRNDGQVGESKKQGGSGVPIIGPNVYHATVERPVRDLRMLDEEQDKWVREIGAEPDEDESDEEGESDEAEP